jgi:uronate dehydrogenase
VVPRKVLVTGSSGAVGQLLLPHLQAMHLDLRLADRLTEGEACCELRDPEDCDRVVRGVSAIIHLAGAAKEAPLGALLPDNALALDNLLRSAVRHGVQHFVFASSMHVMGMYERRDAFNEYSEPQPDSFYAVCKLQGEALCRLYTAKRPLSATCLRLGSVTERLEDADPGAWISPEDVVSMVDIALRLPVPSFEIFHAVADYSWSPLPYSRARHFGYRCARSAGSYRRVLEKVQTWWRDDEFARTRRGATFAAASLEDPKV